MKIQFKLPYPPSINSYYLINKAGQKFLDKKVVQHRNTAIILINHQIKRSEFNLPIKEDVCLWLEIYPPDNRCRDIDNINKATFDVIQHAGVIENDRLIKEQHARMFPKQCNSGQVKVCITDMNSEDWFQSLYEGTQKVSGLFPGKCVSE